MEYSKFEDRKSLIDIFVNYNNQLNLSAIREPQDIFVKHILDSIELNKIIKFKPGDQVVDIGTGGGFPLLPLAMTNNQVDFVGIDSKRKKVDTINLMTNELNLTNAQAMWTRIEDYKGQFDYLTARAVGFIDKIMDRCYHLVKKSGYFVFYKQFSEQEEKILNMICIRDKLKLVQRHEYKLFEGDIQRVIYVLQKM